METQSTAVAYADFLFQAARRCRDRSRRTLFQPLSLAVATPASSILNKRITPILNPDMNRNSSKRLQTSITVLVGTVGLTQATLSWRTESVAHEFSDPTLTSTLDLTMIESASLNNAHVKETLDYLSEQISMINVNLVHQMNQGNSP